MTQQRQTIGHSILVHHQILQTSMVDTIVQLREDLRIEELDLIHQTEDPKVLDSHGVVVVIPTEGEEEEDREVDLVVPLATEVDMEGEVQEKVEDLVVLVDLVEREVKVVMDHQNHQKTQLIQTQENLESQLHLRNFKKQHSMFSIWHKNQLMTQVH